MSDRKTRGTSAQKSIKRTLLSQLADLAKDTPENRALDWSVEKVRRIKAADRADRIQIDPTVKIVAQVKPIFPCAAYSRVISPLSPADGGGFLVTFPDLPGCMSDGPTESEALANAEDAFLSWVSARTDQGKKIPPPKGLSGKRQPGK
jgi:predicted RNase H-like HicB family nuclease